MLTLLSLLGLLCSLLAVPANSAAAATPSGGGYVPLTSVRIVDTRTGIGLPGKVSGAAASFQVAGLAGVPTSGVSAVMLDVTALNSSGVSWVALWPAGTTVPGATNLYTDMTTQSNATVVPLNSSGRVNISTGGITTDVVVDVAGYFTTGPAGAGFEPVAARRLVDTRSGIGGRSLPVGLATSVDFNLGAVVPAEAGTAAINVTVVPRSGGGSTPRNGWIAMTAPDIRGGMVNADYSPTPTANMVFAPVSNGHVMVRNGAGSEAIDVIIDVQGYFLPGASGRGTFVSQAGRLVDTRVPTQTPIPAGATARFVLGGKLGVPTTNVSALLISVMAVSPSVGGFIRVWGASDTEPGTSNVNFDAGMTEDNTAAVRVSPSSTPTILVRNGSSAPVNVVVDLQGWFTLDSSAPPTITSSLYVAGGSVEYTDDGPTTNFAWKPAGSGLVAAYRYSLDDGPAVTQAGTELAWYPNPGPHRLTVFTVSTTGAVSDPATFAFTVTAIGIPDVPTQLRTGATDTDSPAISAVASARTGGMVTMRMYLTDVAGSPVAASPYAQATEQSGGRVTVRIPAGTLTSGQTYKWSAEACSEAGCSDRTQQEALIVNPVMAVAPVTRTAVIDLQHLKAVSVNVSPTGCAGAPCMPLVGGALKVGSDGVNDWRTYLSLDPAVIPPGSIITSANLKMGLPTRFAGSDPVTVETREMTAAWTTSDTGIRLAELVQTGEPYESRAVDTGAAVSLDASSVVQAWAAGAATPTGLELRAANESATNAVAFPWIAMSGAPSVEVTYVPPEAPGPPRQLSATAGDGGTVLAWSPPRDSGYSGGVDEYRVVLRTADGSVAAQTTTDSPSADVSGLVNGVRYTASVVSHTAHGESPPVSMSVTPVAGPVPATVLVEAAGQFFEARMRLQDGTTDHVSAALVGLSRASLISNAVTAQAPKLLADRNLVRAHSGIQLATGTVEVTGILVVPTPTGAVVRARVKTSLPNVADGETVAEQGDNQESLVFDRGTGATPVIVGRFDTQAADDIPDLDQGGDTPPSGSEASAASVGANGSVTLGSDGWPATSSGSVTATGDPYAGNRMAMVAWARAHFQDPWPFEPACTNFVSRALKDGFGMRFRATPMWLGWQYQLARYRDSHYWWYFGSARWLHTFSWGAANNLNQFLTLNGVTSRPFFGRARPGDIVFIDYKEPTNGNRPDGAWDHVAVVTKVVATRVAYDPIPYVTEQEDNHRDQSLMAIWRAYGGPNIRIIRPDFR